MYAGYRKKKNLSFLQFPKGPRVTGISTSANLNLAEGKLIMRESDVYEFVKNNIATKLPNMTSYSGVISCNTESLSTLPQAIIPGESLTATINIDGVILIIDNTQTPLHGDTITANLIPAPSSANTAKIDDINCNGSEDSKYITEIHLSNLEVNVSNLGKQIIALLTPQNEIITGYLDTDTNTLKSIERGSFITNINTPNQRGVLNNGDTLTLLSLNRIYIDKDGQCVVDNKKQYHSNYDPQNPTTNEKLFRPILKQWFNYNNSWYKFSYAFVGYAVCNNLTCIGCKTIDTSLELMDLNNISLSYKGQTIFTNSKRILLSCCDNIIDLDVGVIRWTEDNIIDGIEILANTKYYIYINGYGTPYLSPVKPFLWDVIGYYRHPYHYWRCLGEAMTNTSKEFSSIIKY